MSALAKSATGAAAAVVVIAIVGFNVFGSAGAIDTETVAPSAPASPAAEMLPPSPAPTTPLIRGGDLEPGTYRAYSPGGWFEFTVPDGWTGRTDQFVATKGDSDLFDNAPEVTMVAWNVTHVYADSCKWTGTLVKARTPATLAEALAAQRGHETVGPTQTSLGGYPARRFVFSVEPDFDNTRCDDDIIRLWPGPGPDEDAGLPIAPGQTTTVYIVDVDGSMRVVGAIRRENSSAADVAELKAVVDSIRFEPRGN